MRKGLGRGASIFIVTLFAVVCAFRAGAYVTVLDDGFNFSPDPVHVVVGDAVYWIDDGSGPYAIIGPWGAFYTPGGVQFLQAGTYPYYDDVGDTGTIYVSANIPPSVTITNPATNAVLTAPASFVFGADASDPDSDGLSDVEFYIGTNRVDDVFSSPFTTLVTNLAAGSYTLTAIAYDNANATATNSIQITVVPLRLVAPELVGGQFQFTATGLTTGETVVLECSTDLFSPAHWVSIATNPVAASSMSFTNTVGTNSHYFRLLQLP